MQSPTSTLAFSVAPVSVRSLGKSGREVLSESLSVTSQLTVESKSDKAENARD